MKIAFRKIPPQKSAFEINYEGLLFKGDFKRESKFADVVGVIVGELTMPCDRCGTDVKVTLDEEVHLKVCDGYYEGEDLDIIENHESYVDFDQIAQSEIEALKSEYHYCETCILEGE
jgi:uncharacterized metal-binding protein YceD (DUF177 family)